MSSQSLMKDGLGEAAIDRIVSGLNAVLPDFDSRGFKRAALDGLEALELKERVRHLIEVMHGFLPPQFETAAEALCRLPEVWDHGDPDDPIRGFAIWPVTDYVAAYGLDHPDAAFAVMERLTHLFSAEFAIRPFIKQHYARTYRQLEAWCDHADEHVRRLVSEGTRPRLPWGMRLQDFIRDPEPTIPFLDRLRQDPSLYVRRSVANHVNDISKDHPDRVVQLCQDWLDQEQGNPDHLQWIVKHATRTLVKMGHPGVFPLLGYDNDPHIAIRDLRLEPSEVALGGEIAFQLVLDASKDHQKYVLDYAIHFVKKNGKRSEKVFKLKTGICHTGEPVLVSKRHSFKAITTRTYYPGEHLLAIHLNGREVARTAFDLVPRN